MRSLQDTSLRHRVEGFVVSSAGSFFLNDTCRVVSLVAVASYKARSLGFCIRHRILRPNVLLFSGLPPSGSHGTRICKILRSERQRQARLYRDYLRLASASAVGIASSAPRWQVLSREENRATEFLWQQVLPRLRQLLPPKALVSRWGVHTVSEVRLPLKVQQVLNHGPKFAVEPKKTAAEELTMVRQVSWLATKRELKRRISEGVDVLSWCKVRGRRLPIQRTVSFLKDDVLALLANKEGGFIVLSADAYKARATDVVLSVLNSWSGESLVQIKTAAKRLCSRLNLDNLVKAFDRDNKLGLMFFFSAKTQSRVSAACNCFQKRDMAEMSS